MKREVLSAATFLVDMLRTASERLSDDQLTKFRDHVVDCLWNHYRDHWFPDKPLKGSGYRCIRINGQLDPLIVRAGALMGMAGRAFRSLFPSELTLWVDPWEVCYRIGESGSICVLYGKPCETSPTPSKEPSTPVKQQSMKTPDTPPATPLSSSPAQRKMFSPSRTPPSAIHYLQQHSPPPSPVSTTNSLEVLNYQQQQQLAYYLMAHSGNNCKDSFRGSGLDSFRGLERLFVSS